MRKIKDATYYNLYFAGKVMWYVAPGLYPAIVGSIPTPRISSMASTHWPSGTAAAIVGSADFSTKQDESIYQKIL